MKYCPGCEKEKSRGDFNKNRHHVDGLASYCRICSREKTRNHYLKNKKVYIEKAARLKKAFREGVDKLKSVPCMDCGRTFPPVAMDFDHRDRRKKAGNVSVLVARGCFKKVRIELAKCDVVCACCHRVRTNTFVAQ